MATAPAPVAAGTSGRLLDDSFLKFLPAPVREPRRPWLVLPLCWLLTLAGAALVAALLSAILPKLDEPDFSFFVGKGWFTVFAVAVATPLVETLILAATSSLLLRFLRAEYAIILSSLGWGIAHSYQAPIWGLVIFWPFLIFTTLYIVWKQRSVMAGILMAWAAHFLHNFFSSVAIAFPGVLPGF